MQGEGWLGVVHELAARICLCVRGVCVVSSPAQAVDVFVYAVDVGLLMAR